MAVTFKPLAFKARIAASRPVPTPETKTLTSSKPYSSRAFWEETILVMI